MQYHISTGLIVKHFEQNCNCPLCEMEKIVETNICRELLADGCMDDDVRKQVNEMGFCLKHFEQLYEMPSKLGLSLQMTTRMNTIFKVACQPKSLKDAKKQSKQLLKEHLVRERNPKLIQRAKELYKTKYGKLTCQVCGFDFEEEYGEIGKDYIEGHHTKPVSEMMDGEQSKPEDIAMVCANCHRMLHRRRPWLTIDELSKLKNK